MRPSAIAIGVFMAVLSGSLALAHEVRPAYLELRQTTPEAYDVLWKVPALGDRRLGIYVGFPGDVLQLVAPRGVFSGEAYIERWAIHCAGGLVGREVRIDGLESTQIDVLARVEDMSGRTQTARIAPHDPTFTVEAEPSAFAVSYTYSVLGVEHILLGVDHLLFVLALLILVRGARRLVATITAFTIAHSITLGCAALGWVHVPGPPVEACIALSIVFVAREITEAAQGRAGLTAKRPWIVALTFGLLHGLGFAGALSEVGLPEAAIPVALFSFNIGVEIGQLAFVAAAMVVMGTSTRAIIAWPRWAEPFPGYAIGGCASFWLIQRVFAF
jgi:hydrogenase/urease accessory protein HupE